MTDYQYPDTEKVWRLRWYRWDSRYRREEDLAYGLPSTYAAAEAEGQRLCGQQLRRGRHGYFYRVEPILYTEEQQSWKA